VASRGWRFALAAWIAAAPVAAVAADMPAAPPNPAPMSPAAYAPAVPDWIVTVGGEARLVPAWPGAPANKFALTGAPLLSFRDAGAPPTYFGPRDSFGFTVLNFGPVNFGPAFKLVWERNASQYTELNGLGNVDFALQAGAFAEFWPLPWLRLRTELRQGFGGETGVTGDAFLDAVVPAGPFRFSGGPRVTTQSAAATSPYFNHCRSIGGLDHIRPANAAGLQSRRRPLFLRRRQPGGISLEPATGGPRLCRIRKADRLGRRFAARHPAQFAEPIHLRARRHLFVQHASVVVNAGTSVPPAAP
jgi:outer membrane scaffolding protein for murein synthesis (MipA/OmpV family)